jgi:hypothetical protein
MGLLSFRLDNFVLGPSLEYHTYDSCLAQNDSQKAEPQKNKIYWYLLKLLKNENHWRMDDKWLGNSFLLGFSSLVNHSG